MRSNARFCIEQAPLSPGKLSIIARDFPSSHHVDTQSDMQGSVSRLVAAVYTCMLDRLEASTAKDTAASVVAEKRNG